MRNDKSTQKHNNHQVFIAPKGDHLGIFCKQCVYQKGKNKGHPVWISWVKKDFANEISNLL